MKPVIVALFLGFPAVAVWGWRSIPVGRRFPIAFGVPPSVEGTMSKPVGLIVHLVTGSILAASSWFAATQHAGMGWIGIGLLTFFLFIEIHTIRRLQR